MKKILVTGSSGYIGKHLCKMLVSQGYEVHGHDIVDEHVDGVILHSLDIRNPIWNTNVMFDCVVHLAALVRVGESVDRPWDYYDTNINGTNNVLNNTTCKNFIFASTGAASAPTSPYGYSKRVAEDIVKEFCTKKNLPYTIFRFFNVIGTDGFPPTNPDGLMYNLRQILKTGKFTIFGDDYNTKDGTCVREYIHVNDICAAIIKAIEEPANDIENLAYGDTRTTKEIFEIFTKVNQLGCQIIYGPKREGDLESCYLENPSKYVVRNYTYEEMLKL